MVLIEFTIEGPPLSHQTRDRSKLQAWRSAVRAAAAKRWRAGKPVADPLRLTVAYYHDGPRVPIDNDNLLMPIQDALKKLVYADDRQITRTVVHKTDINGSFYVRGASSVLLAGFSVGSEFLYVKVELESDRARLPE